MVRTPTCRNSRHQVVLAKDPSYSKTQPGPNCTSTDVEPAAPETQPLQSEARDKAVGTDAMRAGDLVTTRTRTRTRRRPQRPILRRQGDTAPRGGRRGPRSPRGRTGGGRRARGRLVPRLKPVAERLRRIPLARTRRPPVGNGHLPIVALILCILRRVGGR